MPGRTATDGGGGRTTGASTAGVAGAGNSSGLDTPDAHAAVRRMDVTLGTIITACLALQAGITPTDSLLARLTLEEKVGQLIMPWMPGTYAAADADPMLRALAWVDSLQIGGIIVSVGSPLDVAVKIRQLQQRSRLPLLVAADLEWGSATRLIGGTPFPSNMGVAATGREDDAYEQGRITALEARAVGIELTFSPVADVNSNPANPIINTRSYGEDPVRVAALVGAFVRGAEEHGLLTTAKHFPGHGDTERDSHLELPVLPADWTRLDSLELVPFRAAVAAGVSAVMTAHLAVPLLAPVTVPATLAPQVLQGLLVDSLGFTGLVVTDALNMGAVVGHYGAGEASVKALEAGADLILQPGDPRAAYKAVRAAARSGRVSEARLDRSVAKILALKTRAGLWERRYPSLDSVPLVVGRAEHLAVAQDVTQRGVTLVKDDGALDWIQRRRRRLAVIGYGDELQSDAGVTMTGELRAGGDAVSYFRLWSSSGPASYDSARAVISSADATIFVPAVRARASRPSIGLPDSLASLIEQTARRGRVVLASLGNPYLYAQVPSVGTYVIGWHPTALAEVAVARALQGRAPIGGRLPISLGPEYPRNYGLSRPAKH